MSFTKKQTIKLQNNGFTIKENSAYFKVGYSSFIQVDKINNVFEYSFIDEGSSFIANRTSSLNKILKFKENFQ